MEDAQLQLGISEDEYAEFEHLAELGDAEKWQRLLSMLIKVESELSSSSYPRLLVEMALVRAASLPPARKIEDLLRKLEEFNTPGSAQRSGGDNASPGGVSRSSSPAQSRSAAPRSAAQLHDSAPPLAKKGQYDASSAPAFTPPARVEEQQHGGGYPQEAKHMRTYEGVASPTEKGETDAEATRHAGSSATISSTPSWEELVQQIGKKNPRIGALLDNVSLLELAPPLLRLGAGQGSFLLQQLKDKETEAKICEIIQILLGEKINLKVEGLAARQAPPSLQQSKQQQESDRSRRLREDAVNHPIVRQAVEIFAGEVVAVTPNDKGYV